MPDTSTTDRTAGEVDWPAWAERTPITERTRTAKFSVTEHQAIKAIRKELTDRLGVDDWRLSTAAPHRKNDGLPYANASPEDPAAVVRWTMDGGQYCIAADEYTKLRDNLRAIGLYIEEKRKMSNRPVKTGQDEFATAALPGEESVDGAVEVAPPAHEVLDVAPDADESVVRAAYRARIKEVHPDQGGSREQYERVQQAREELLG